MTLSAFIDLHNHHHHLVPEHLYHPKRKPCPRGHFYNVIHNSKDSWREAQTPCHLAQVPTIKQKPYLRSSKKQDTHLLLHGSIYSIPLILRGYIPRPPGGA